MMTEPWEQAMTYKGVRFRHRGRSRHCVDCVGLLICVAKDLGREVFDLRVYGRDPSNDGLQGMLEQNCGPPVNREPQVNDILLLRHRKGEEPSHVALVCPYPQDGELGMIHTYAAIGRVTWHRLDERWRSRIVAIFPWET